MEKNLLKDILEGLWEPIRNIEYIRKEYGLKDVKIYSSEDGYLKITIDNEDITRCFGIWTHTEKLPFDLG